ncbi:MAG: hypothetical protein EOP50_02890 [Sphingobacteriales bacterium]|nr:MAG: hypothetical protein EOP50_02890 [Sphingobacteriales bacterium]
MLQTLIKTGGALLLMTGALRASAQNAPDSMRQVYIFKADSVVLSKVKLDFAVPDIPAFKALDVDPSNILRPSAPRDFSLMLSGFRGTSLIPKDLAVEVAPALFLKPWYTKQQYRQQYGLRLLTKTRISFGTKQDDVTSVNSVAFGLRTTLFDKGDFRLDSSFERSIYFRLDQVQDAWGTLVNNYKAKVGIEAYASLGTVRQNAITDSLYFIAQGNGVNIDSFVRNSIQEYKKKNWNASRLDFAYALQLQSPDSLVSNVRLNKHALWATLALRPGKNNHWAQILLGFRAAPAVSDDTWYNDMTGSFRFYGGTNRFKGLLELQYQNTEHPGLDRTESFFTQVGVELNVYQGIWLQFSTGILNALNGDNKSSLRNNLNLSFALPENFRLF